MPPESQTPLPVQQNNRIEPYYHFHLYSWPECTYRQHNTVAVDNAPRQSYRGGNFSLLSHYHSSSSRSSLPGHHQLLSKH